MCETCFILVGKRFRNFWFARLVKKSIGTQDSVSFDGRWVLEREEKKGDILGFYHTHQAGIKLSKRDIKTMAAWASCFGKSLYCVIESFPRRLEHNIRIGGTIEVYTFLPEDAPAYGIVHSVLKVGSLAIGNWIGGNISLVKERSERSYGRINERTDE